MDMDPIFMSYANQVHLRLNGKDAPWMNPHTSGYNANVFMDDCGIRECSRRAEETHHIKEQMNANQDNMIDHHHKNIKHNLVPLCQQCHKRVTYGNLRIYGYQDTTQGPRLHYEYVDTTVVKRPCKYTPEQLQTVRSYKERIETNELSKAQCIRDLEMYHGIKMTSQTLKKYIS